MTGTRSVFAVWACHTRPVVPDPHRVHVTCPKCPALCFGPTTVDAKRVLTRHTESQHGPTATPNPRHPRLPPDPARVPGPHHGGKR